MLRVRLQLTADFRWNDRVHGKTAEPFWVWVEDPSNDHMYHHEYFLLTKKQVSHSLLHFSEKKVWKWPQTSKKKQ